jgi:hypothetical protein
MDIRKTMRSGLPSVAPSVVARPTGAPDVEWTASPLRPVAHWVSMPIGTGRRRLEMVWEVPDPMASGAGALSHG